MREDNEQCQARSGEVRGLRAAGSRVEAPQFTSGYMGHERHWDGMFIRHLTHYLETGDYQQVITKVPQIKVFYRRDQEKVYCILFIDDTNAFLKSQEQFHEIYAAACNMFQKNLSVSGIALVVTDEVERSRRMLPETDPFWLVELSSERLIQYENQPDQFDILKESVECSFASVYGYRKPAFLKARRISWFKSLLTVNTLLVLINLIVFTVMEFFGDTNDAYYMYEHGAMCVEALFVPSQYYRMLTAAFEHFGVLHLSNNMLSLAIFGRYVEPKLGKWKYLILYLAVCIGANLVSGLYYYNTAQQYVISAGASGAIFGVIGALLYIVIRNRGRLEELTTRRVLFLLALSIYQGFQTVETNNVAHISGMLLGFLGAVILYRKKKDFSQPVSTAAAQA